ncbi:hypothetical protein Droror1_Dr00011917 [Drosera rotundifolia]
MWGVSKRLHKGDCHYHFSNYYHAELGHIWVLWDLLVAKVHYIDGSDQVFHTRIKEKDGKFEAIVSILYARNSAAQRNFLSENLKQYGYMMTKPGCLLGL